MQTRRVRTPPVSLGRRPSRQSERSLTPRGVEQVPQEIDLGRTPILKHNQPTVDDDPDAIEGSVYIPQGKIVW